jgi:two-component system, LytTR family, sensor kinase
MRKRRLYWKLQVIGWTLYAVLNLILVWLNPLGSDTPDSIIKEQQIQVLIHTFILFLFTHLVLRRTSNNRQWVEKDFGKVMPSVIGMVLAMTVLATVIVHFIYSLFENYTLDSDTIATILLDTVAYLVIFIFWAAIYFLYHYLDSNNKSLKFEAAVNEMQLNQLKSQLNPHFIFNALNSMRALVDENPSKAKIAITQLSNILRKSLIMDKLRVVDFNEELNTVKDYLALESIRFEERLRVSYDIDKNSENFQIPPMMMQTLVENAIKHGVSNLIDGGEVELIAYVKEFFLFIQIRNSGQLVNGVAKKPKQGGYGLANTKQRLKLIYGGEASFRIYNENDKFVTTEVKIPQRF